MKVSEKMYVQTIESILIDGYSRISLGRRGIACLYAGLDDEWILALDDDGNEIARYNLRHVAEIVWMKS